MKLSKLIGVLPLIGLLSMPAIADDDYREYRFEQRIDRQKDRIRHGVKNGELTRKEAKKLRRQNRHIAKLERRFTRDGHLDRYERRTLRQELNQANRKIRKLKHNDRYRDRGYVRQYHNYHYYPRYERYDDKHYRHKRYDDNGWSVVFGLWDHW